MLLLCRVDAFGCPSTSDDHRPRPVRVFDRRGVCEQWGAEVSQNWDKLEGADAGQTHVDHPDEGEMAVWAHPVDLHYVCKVRPFARARLVANGEAVAQPSAHVHAYAECLWGVFMPPAPAPRVARRSPPFFFGKRGTLTPRRADGVMHVTGIDRLAQAALPSVVPGPARAHRLM